MLTLFILKTIKAVGELTTDSLLFSYSSSAVWKKIRGGTSRRRRNTTALDGVILRREEKVRFYNLLSKLKRQGLVQKNSNAEGKTIWKITGKGKDKLEHTARVQHARSLQPSGDLVNTSRKIVIFDIPESQKYYRLWLRETLRNFQYSMLQKSVWIGNKKLPESFLHKLREFKILKYVYIFSVADEGSLR
jgi:DNA-binding transcriptional regulator PaaX